MTSDDTYQPERRPIASREKRISHVLARWLARTGMSPNAISLAGMVAGVAAGAALAATALTEFWRAGFVIAAVLMQLRLLANMLDGMVAERTGAASPVGELFNEVPDRVSDAAAFIGAGYALGGCPPLGYGAACLAIFVAYVRAQGKVAGAPQEFCGPMAKPQRVFVLTLMALFCGFAPERWQQVLEIRPDWGTVSWVLCLIIAGEVVTSIRRLSRVAASLRSRET